MRRVPITVGLAALFLLAAMSWRSRTPPVDPTALEDWSSRNRMVAELTATGHWDGPRDAPAVLLVYSSYACAWCNRLATSLQGLRERYPDHLAVVWKSMMAETNPPLERVAMAAECAADQSLFAAYHAKAFEESRLVHYHDGWLRIAEGVADMDPAALAECVRSGHKYDVLADHSMEADRLGLIGTPSMILNGRAFLGYPGKEHLDRLIALEFPGRREVPRRETVVSDVRGQFTRQ